jgi:hypothetical protein
MSEPQPVSEQPAVKPIEQGVMDNEISGGPKVYTHQQYGLGCVVDYDRSELRWFKKLWVPEWLFRWFAKPDMIDLLDHRMAEVKEQDAKELYDRISNR